MTIYPKQRQVPVDYVVDWGGALNGRRLAASDWSIHPAEHGGLTVTADAIGPTATRAILTGGIAGRRYRVSGRATFADGSTATRALQVEVR